MIPETLDDLRARHRYRIEVIDGESWEILDIPGPGIPVIFLAGGQGTAEMFFKPMLKLEGYFQILGIHYPPQTDAALLAKGLARLLDRLSHDRCSIVGSSFGGYIAQFFAADFAERVDRLLLCNTFVNAEAAKTLSLFNRKELETYAPHAFKAERVAAIEHMEPRELREVMRDQMAARQSAESLYARMMGVAVSKFAPQVAIPLERVAIVDCEDDTVILPEMKKDIKLRFAGADIQVLATGGHYPHILNADAYTNILRDLLQHGNGTSVVGHQLPKQERLLK